MVLRDLCRSKCPLRQVIYVAGACISVEDIISSHVNRSVCLVNYKSLVVLTDNFIGYSISLYVPPQRLSYIYYIFSHIKIAQPNDTPSYIRRCIVFQLLSRYVFRINLGKVFLCPLCTSLRSHNFIEL